jgi:hypothetical protein
LAAGGVGDGDEEFPRFSAHTPGLVIAPFPLVTRERL